MSIMSENLTYAALGRAMHGRLFRDDDWREPRPAVLVFPEGFGISEHTYDAARRLAGLGYVALACDLYGDGYFHNGPTPYLVERHQELTSDPGTLREIGGNALAALAARTDVDAARIAAIGYCLGGTIAIELGFAGAPLAAIGTFHPTFTGLTLADAGKTPCPLQMYIGADDYACPPDARTTLERAFAGSGVRWEMTVYGAVKHSFTNPNCQGMGDAVAYDAEADRHSWHGLATLLAKVFARE